MFYTGERVKINLSGENLEVYRLMGDQEPWFQNGVATIQGLAYEHNDDYFDVTESFYLVEMYNNCSTRMVLSENNLKHLE